MKVDSPFGTALKGTLGFGTGVVILAAAGVGLLYAFGAAEEYLDKRKKKKADKEKKEESGEPAV